MRYKPTNKPRRRELVRCFDTRERRLVSQVTKLVQNVILAGISSIFKKKFSKNPK